MVKNNSKYSAPYAPVPYRGRSKCEQPNRGWCPPLAWARALVPESSRLHQPWQVQEHKGKTYKALVANMQ
eukprot:6430462-Amphidinium_carterae.1